MKRNEAFPSLYLNQEDVLAGPITATIADVRIETIKTRSGEQEKPIMKFREKGLKSFVVNKVCWKVFETAYGADSDTWAGQVIELYHDPGVMLGDEQVGGVRVRIPAARHAAAATTSREPADPYPIEQALEDCAKVGRDKAWFIEQLKAHGLTGYSPTKDADTARSFISAEAGAVDDTIPF